MSYDAQRWAREQETGSSGTKHVLLTLAEHADAHGYCFPSQQTIAKVVEMGLRSVRRHLQALERSGLIRRVRRHRQDGSRTSDGYYLLAPAERLAPCRPTGQSDNAYRPNCPNLAANLAYHEPVIEPNSLPTREQVAKSRGSTDALELVFGDALLETLLIEVPVRRNAWHGLSPVSIADAISSVTDGPGWRTGCKLWLDIASGITAPRTERFSGGGGERRASQPTAAKNDVREPYRYVRGQNPDTYKRDKERWEREQRAGQPAREDTAARSQEQREEAVRERLRKQREMLEQAATDPPFARDGDCWGEA